VPVTVLQTLSASEASKRQSSDIHPSYHGTVFFRNVFDGQLAATDYPKVNVRGSSNHLLSCLTIFVVLFCHVPPLFCIGGCLGLVVLQTRRRDSSHTSKGHLEHLLSSLTGIDYYLVLLIMSRRLPHHRDGGELG
jgi:hypothetical protein